MGRSIIVGNIENPSSIKNFITEPLYRIGLSYKSENSMKSNTVKMIETRLEKIKFNILNL